MTDRLVLLKRSVGAIPRRRHPGQLLEGEEAIAFLTQDGIRYGRVSVKSGLVFGFTQVGALAIAALAADLRQSDPAYKRGSFLPTFASAVAGTVLDKLGEAATPTVTAADLIALEAGLRTWFAQIAGPTTRYVSCALVAERVDPFEIGPITFVHASELAMHPRSPISSGMAQNELNPLYRFEPRRVCRRLQPLRGWSDEQGNDD